MHFVIVLLVVGIIAGLLYYLVQRAPFIPDPFKPVLLWIILAFCVLFVIIEVLLPMIGDGHRVLLR